MTTQSSEAWTRLGHVIVERIDELGLTRAEVQSRGGPSPAKIREITNGRSKTLSPSKRRDLERALGWEEGAVDDVLEGGDPRVSSPPLSAAAQAVSDDLTDALQRYVDSQPALPPGRPLQHQTVRALFLAVEDLKDALQDAYPASPDVVAPLRTHMAATINAVNDVLLEHFDGEKGVGAAFTYLVGWKQEPDMDAYEAGRAAGAAAVDAADKAGLFADAGGQSVGLDDQAERMTDEQLTAAASGDPIWADYIKTKRPELAKDWEY